MPLVKTKSLLVQVKVQEEQHQLQQSSTSTKHDSFDLDSLDDVSIYISEYVNSDEPRNDNTAPPHPRKFKRVTSFNNNIDFTPSSTVNRNGGHRNHERLKCWCRQDLQWQKKISNQQQHINDVMDDLKVEKEKCIFLNKTLNSTVSDAAAAIELDENEKVIDVAD
jgi:hypothetical protein